MSSKESKESRESKQKKVHYERGTKGSSHHHRSSRDSGVGSSSASDRASLGTAPNESPFNYQQIETQRHNLRAVQEALDAANERIRQYEASTFKLNTQLSESNKENRLLKKEKSELLNRVEDLEDDLDHEKSLNERLRREASPRNSSARSSPPRRSIEERPRSHHSNRSSYQQPPPQQQQQMYPAAPQPPPNSAPNPFLPLPKNSGVPITYAPAGAINYAPSTASYSTASTYAHAPPPNRSHYPKSNPNDGKYHLTPL